MTTLPPSGPGLSTGAERMRTFTFKLNSFVVISYEWRPPQAEDQDFADSPTENEICTAAEIGLHAFWRLWSFLFTEGSNQEALAHLELESRKNAASCFGAGSSIRIRGFH